VRHLIVAQHPREPERRDAARLFPKSVEQNCSEKNRSPNKHGRVPRGGRVIKKEIKLKYV